MEDREASEFFFGRLLCLTEVVARLVYPPHVGVLDRHGPHVETKDSLF